MPKGVRDVPKLHQRWKSGRHDDRSGPFDRPCVELERQSLSVHVHNGGFAIIHESWPKAEDSIHQTSRKQSPSPPALSRITRHSISLLLPLALGFAPVSRCSYSAPGEVGSASQGGSAPLAAVTGSVIRCSAAAISGTPTGSASGPWFTVGMGYRASMSQNRTSDGLVSVRLEIVSSSSQLSLLPPG
jgi:hypothetical protein